MKVPTVEKLELTAEEARLFELVDVTEHDLANDRHGDVDEMLDACFRLTSMLVDRKAVPHVRWRYFLDADYNVGGHGRSRMQVFEKNGCRGNDVFRHPHFIKHLRYLVSGPALPNDVIEGFRQILIDDAGTSGMILDQLRSYARAQARRLASPRNHSLHEEFFKLALECGQDMHTATCVRRAAQEGMRR